MTIAAAITHVFNNEAFEGRKRLWVDDEEAARIISQLFIAQNIGGPIYGKFIGDDTKSSTGEWWEIEYYL